MKNSGRRLEASAFLEMLHQAVQFFVQLGFDPSDLVDFPKLFNEIKWRFPLLVELSNGIKDLNARSELKKVIQKKSQGEPLIILRKLNTTADVKQLISEIKAEINSRPKPNPNPEPQQVTTSSSTRRLVRTPSR